MFPDYVAHAFLQVNREYVILPFLIVGFIWLNRNLFFHVICITLLGIVYNGVLKVTFKVPLASHLGKSDWYAFPSGHMQLATVLYGWIAYQLKNPYIRILVAIVLTGVGISLVQLGFHTYFDSFGGLISGLVLIAVYVVLSSNMKENLHLILLGLSSSLMLYFYWKYGSIRGQWVAYYGLVGFIVSDRLFAYKTKSNLTIINKIFATVLAFSLMYSIRYLYPMVIHNVPPSIYNLQWAIVGMVLPFSTFIGCKMDFGGGKK